MGSQVFAKRGIVYAIYLPQATKCGQLDLTGRTGEYEQRWYNPRTGRYEGETTIVRGGGRVDLGSPPAEPEQDWAVLVTRA